MTNPSNYEEKIEEIRDIPEQDVQTPYSPVDVYLQEAENLFHWLKPDRELLIGAGVPAELIDDIPIRAGALREAQALWIQELNTRREYQQQWKEKSPDAYDLRDELIHTLRYAYRNHPDLLGRISFIDEDYGHADMIQDLYNLAILGKNNPEPLKAIGFDMSMLDEALQVSDEMADLLARANGEKRSDHMSKLIRDKAYTHLKEAVDEVRDCGKYLFWRNEERYKGYCSAYMRRLNNKRRSSQETEELDGAEEEET